MATADDVLKIARGEIGYSRWNDPQTGTKYGRWYAAKTSSPYFGSNGVPYCAMFVSWCFDQAKGSAAGLPGAYCPTMLQAAKSAGKTVPLSLARAGDVVYFDFARSGVTGHVGIIEATTGTYLVTIEGNTSSGTAGSQSNGGVVARRTRAYSTVAGVVRPTWTATPVVTTPSKPASGSQNGAQLAVDGVIGPASVRRLQAILGTPVDGVISGQYSGNRARLAAITSIDYSGGGSLMVAALQAKLGTDTDGYLGPDTIKAWQKRLHVAVDGYLGINTARAIQRALNAGGLW